MSRPGASRWPRVHEGRLNEAAQHGANFERDRGDGGAIRKGAPRLDRHTDPGGAVDAFLAERLRIVERVRSLMPDIVTGRSASALVVATQTLLRRRSTSDPIDESA